MKAIVVIPHMENSDLWHEVSASINCLFVWESHMRQPNKRLCDLQTIVKDLKHLSEFSGIQGCCIIFSKEFMTMVNRDLCVTTVIEKIEDLFLGIPVIFNEWNDYVI